MVKNKITRLEEFIKMCSLFYHCKKCLDLSAKVLNQRLSLNKDCDEVSTQVNKQVDISSTLLLTNGIQTQLMNSTDQICAQIADIGSRIDSLQAGLHEKLNAFDQFKLPDVKQNDNKTSIVKPQLSFADVVASDIVKNVVSQTIKEQQKVDSDICTIVVYGFPEDGNDYYDLLNMFDFLECNCKIVRYSRFVRVVKKDNTFSGRPIKVELRSSGDVNFVLSCAKQLSKDAYYSGVYVNKWLSEEEMKNVKYLCQLCFDLNKTLPTDKRGRKPFVLISGKIMKRNAQGKLQTYDSLQCTFTQSSNQTGVSLSQMPNKASLVNLNSTDGNCSKNAIGGSQVAPSKSS
mgnify:CR=1 FL=1